jgi:hypothetical protein
MTAVDCAILLATSADDLAQARVHAEKAAAAYRAGQFNADAATLWGANVSGTCVQ